MQLGDEQPFRFLVHDRNVKFRHAFDEVFRTEGITVIRPPVQAERGRLRRTVGRTVRADCLDPILILGRRHLEHLLRVYHRHLRAQAAPRPSLVGFGRPEKETERLLLLN